MIEIPRIPHLVLSVDPGKNTAWSIYKDGIYQQCGLLETVENEDKDKDVVERIKSLLHNISTQSHANPETDEAPVLVVENQFLGKNPSSQTKLVQCRMRWETLAYYFGFEVVRVAPATWQSKITKKMPGKTTKERSIRYCRDVLGINPHTDDLADAFCIAQWYLQKTAIPVESASGKSSVKRKPKRRKNKRG